MTKRLPGSRLIPLFSIVFFVALATVTVTSSVMDLEFKFRLLVLIPVASILTNILLLFKIARSRRHIKSILWFGFFIVATIFWALADLLTFLAADAKTGLFARSFVLIPALVGVASVIIFFSDATSDRDELPIAPRVLMLFNVLFYLVVGLGTNVLFDRRPEAMIQRSWGWESELGPAGILYLVWTQLMLLVTLWIVVRYYLTRKQRIQKKQARIFLISVLVPVLGSTTVNLVPAILGIPIIPLDSLFTTGMAIFMTYGINKYQLLTISPTQISNNILRAMSEAVVVTDTNFAIQYANQNAVKMLELDEPVADSEQNIKAFFGDSVFEELKEATKKATDGNQDLNDLEVVSKNTHNVTPVEISVSNVESEGKSSGAAGHVFVISDISALQQAYAKLAEQEKKVERKVIERTEELYAEHAKLETSIAGLPIGLIMLDENMSIIENNKVAKELLGIRGESRWYVEDILAEIGLGEKFLEMSHSKRIVDINEIVLDGRTLHLIFSPIVTSKDKMIGSVIIIEDISSRKAAEKERNEFIVTASHEIRTPLTVIQGNLSNALEMGKKIDKNLVPLLKTAYRASNQISSLFNDVLIIADIESESRSKKVYKISFSMKDLAMETVERFKIKAKEKNLKLSLGATGSGWMVHADKDELGEALAKLVDNAIKFTKKGAVTVSLSNSSGKVVVRVIDSGDGIAKEEETQLFKKFVRLDNRLKRELGGAGLGLYIAKALVERNRGELILEESSKKGSIFKLSVPAGK